MGYNPAFKESAKKLGEYIIANQMNLVYGGADVGLMKIIAEYVLHHGGHVTGVMPRHLVEKEVAFEGLSTLEIVESMSERKNLMVELSDCFVALPGGFGTLDEMVEVITCNQLRLIHKPLGFLNIAGFYNNLFLFFKGAMDQGFLRKEHYNNLIIEEDIEQLFNKLESFSEIKLDKWIHDIKKESNSTR